MGRLWRLFNVNVGKKMKRNNLVLFVFLGIFSSISLAAGGGLASATSWATELKSWLFIFTGIAALIYMLYSMLMAFMERKTWGDVGMALVYCSLAGGAVVGGTWALEMFQ